MIKLELSGRQAGKTYNMVEWASKDPNRVIIVADEQQRKFLLDQYGSEDEHGKPTKKDWGIKADQVMVAHNARKRLLGMHARHPEIGIDNLDLVLWSLFGDVQQATATDIYVVIRSPSLNPYLPPDK